MCTQLMQNIIYKANINFIITTPTHGNNSIFDNATATLNTLHGEITK